MKSKPNPDCLYKNISDHDKNGCVKCWGGMTLPKYQKHRVVEAIQIKKIVKMIQQVEGYLYPVKKGVPIVIVSEAYMSKHMPNCGGYYLKYADGYESYSLQGTFKDSYIQIKKEGK